MVISSYIDIMTGEIVAYKYANKGFCVLVSEQKAKELKLEDSDILSYLDLHTTYCIKYQDKIYTLGSECSDLLFRFSTDLKELRNANYRREILENTPEYNYNGEYDEDSKKVLLFGYLFDKYNGIAIDNETAIRRFLDGSEECM